MVIEPQQGPPITENYTCCVCLTTISEAKLVEVVDIDFLDAGSIPATSIVFSLLMLDIIVKILIITNGVLIFFFLQFVIYGLLAYYYYFKEKKHLNLNIEWLKNLALQKNKEIPTITIIIPAKDENEIIASTIDRFMSLNYPKEKLHLLLVLDDKELLIKPYDETTHCVVEQKKNYYNKLYNLEIIKYVSVPVGFDGNYNGIVLNKPVNSTKPRALNWALKFIPEETDILGFYDSDSHPDVNTLLYVAYKYLTKSENDKILLQGPVVQVRNYFNLKPLNKIYALAQAITHEWYLPILLTHLPFIGGTNFFIEPDLLYKVQGFKCSALSEDLELGCRLYIETTNVWPEFMPYIATEQTPPNYKAYFHQRVRWASGYVQVIKSMLTSNKFLYKRFLLFSMLIFYGILPWFSAQILSILSMGILLLSILGLTHLVFSFVPPGVKALVIFMNFAYILFLFFYFTYTIKKLNIKKYSNHSLVKEYLNLLLVPIAATLGTIPYTYGFLISFFSHQPVQWIKTIRTKE